MFSKMNTLETYKTVFNHSKDGVIITNNAGKIILVNREIEFLLGFSKDELIGQEMEIFIPKRYLQKFQEQRDIYSTNPTSRSLGLKKGFIVQHKDGNEFLVEVRLNPVEIDEKPVTIVFVNLVPQAKADSFELLKSNERYSGLLKNLDTGIVVHAADTTIKNANPKAEELLGQSNNQLLGKQAMDPDWKFISEDKSPLPFEKYPVVQINTTKQALKTFVAGVYRPLKKDIVWLVINGFPLFDNNGQIMEVVISFHDITERKHLQNQIEQELSTKDVFLNSSIDMFWSVDKNLNLFTANESFFKNTLSETKGTLKPGENVLRADLYDELTLLKWKELYQKVLAGEVIQFEYQSKSNQKIAGKWYELKMSPITLGTEIIGVACFGKNITERKIAEIDLTKAKEKAEQNESKLRIKNQEFEAVNAKLNLLTKTLQEEISLRQVIERTIPSGLSVADGAGKQVYVNQSFCNLFGFNEEELIGKVPPYIYWPEEEIPNISAAFEATLKNQAPKEGFDLIFKHKSGKLIPVQVIVSSYEQEDKQTYWLANVIDITERKIKENEISNKNQRINSIINSTNDVICSIDLNFNISEFNNVIAQAVKQAYGVEMKSGMPILNFIESERVEHTRAIYKRVELGETVSDIRSFHSFVSGTTAYHETNYHPIFSFDKKIIGITIFSKDITERVKSEQKIIAALKEKEILLAEIHHRIKNNLTLIWSLLQLQEMNTSNQEVKEALSLSRKRIKSTASIHELLYKSESLHDIKLDDYLKELFGYLNMNTKIELNYQGNDISLDMNSAMPLGLLLNELLLNSFKHSYTENSQGEIKIKAQLDYPHLLIEYFDFEGVFSDEVDFKNSNTTGLTLAHTFAEQLNGSIDLISKCPPAYRIQLNLNDSKS